MTTAIRDNSLSMLLLNAYRGRPLTFLGSHASCVPALHHELNRSFRPTQRSYRLAGFSLDEPASLLHIYARTKARFQKGISRQVDFIQTTKSRAHAGIHDPSISFWAGF